MSANTACHDCGVDTLPAEWGRNAEYYMVHDDVWAQASAHPHTFLCIGCLERRLRRRLTPADFTDAAINDPAARPGRKSWSHRTQRRFARGAGGDIWLRGWSHRGP